jgi:hypothetical protein
MSNYASGAAQKNINLDTSGGVESVFGRTGAVTAQTGDYVGSEITNDSAVIGATVSDALDQLESDIAGAKSGIRLEARRGADPGDAPGGQTLNIGVFEVRANQSQFQNGATQRISGIFQIPDDADITQPVTYYFEYVLGNLNQAASDLLFIFYRALVSDGDRIDGTQTPSSVTIVPLSVPANASLLRFRASATFDISGAIPGDSVAWSLERQGTLDTFAAPVTVPTSDFFLLEPA